MCVQEFEVRKLARVEGRRYCNASALTYQAERMPEQIRVNVSLLPVQTLSVPVLLKNFKYSGTSDKNTVNKRCNKGHILIDPCIHKHGITSLQWMKCLVPMCALLEAPL